MAEKKRPVNGWVLLKNANADKTDGGIIVPDFGTTKHAMRRSKTAIVAAVSEGWLNPHTGKLVEPRVKVGDSVWLADGRPVVMWQDDPDYCLVHQEDICCVFEKAGN